MGHTELLQYVMLTDKHPLVQDQQHHTPVQDANQQHQIAGLPQAGWLKT
jgi:hypothetical protein